MEFIKAEEFLKQPVEVQKVFIEWWKPNIGDLFAWASDKDIQDCREVQCCLSENTVISSSRWKGIKEGERLPLLSEGQLRQFIEDKKNGIIDITHDICNGGYNFEIWLINEMKRLDNDEYFSLGNNLLQAYWKVAIEIAKE